MIEGALIQVLTCEMALNPSIQESQTLVSLLTPTYLHMKTEQIEIIKPLLDLIQLHVSSSLEKPSEQALELIELWVVSLWSWISIKEP